MYVSMQWLRRLVDIDETPGRVARMLTMAGFPVVDADVRDDDVGIEVEVTSNRPDLQSHVGIARELAGLLGTKCRWPAATLPELSDDRIRVAVDAPDLCPRYTARIVRGVRVGPSPDWLVRLLTAVGQRSVNNVVDITNFLLLETGHPLHAFDLARLSGPEIVARRSGGEEFTTIDGSKLRLRPDDLVIADAARPVALAGVMGGLDSEVGEQTRDVVVECALFDPLAIRAASRGHQIRSESSFRFERFVDPARLDYVSDRAAGLLVELCGAESVGPICSAGPGVPVHAAEIDLRTAQVERVLGIGVSEDEARGILVSLGLAARPGATVGVTAWTAPSWRADLVEEIDLIEEVARRVGFDRVPGDVAIPVRPLQIDRTAEARGRLRDALVRAGLRECCTAPFVGSGHEDVALLRDRPALRVQNPMRAGEDLMRRSLLGPLLRVVRGNQDRGVTGVRFFECAPVYLPHGGDQAEEPRTDEILLASGVLTGDYDDVKGVLDDVLAALGIGDVTFESGGSAPLRADRAATLRLRGELLGHAGELGRTALGAFGIDGPIAVFEVRADLLAAHACLERPYRPISRFPAVERDLAVVVEDGVSWGSIRQTVTEAAGELLADLLPFDVYRGGQVPAGSKSVALRMELRALDRTLTGDEADACVTRVVDALASAVGGVLRT